MITPSKPMVVSGFLAMMVTGVTGYASSAAAQSQTFSCTGSAERFTVPTGANQLHIEARGAQGQARSGTLRAGYGGIVTATVPVTGGEVLTIYVGCHSDEEQGFGWGIGGDHGHADGAYGEDGGFGGGGSGVLRSDQTELVVAGGGGGAGGDGGPSGLGGQGAAGGNGGIDPQPGGRGCGSDGCPNLTGGRGGCAACASGTGGESGTHSSTFDDGGGGGGGGGGHVGGGGGHGGGGSAGFGDGGGGGGGGSSYVIGSATNVSYGTDTSGGDGIVILSWSVSGSAIFTCSDGATTFTVPDDVTQVRFEVHGAAGAPGRNGGGFVTGHGGAGGLGGLVTATMAVTAGEQFAVQAGCADANGFRQGGGGGPGGSTGSGGNGGGLSAVYAPACCEYYIMTGGGGGGGGAGISGDGGAGGDAGNPATNGRPGTNGGAVGGCSNGEAGCGSSSNTDPNGSGDPGLPGSDVSNGGGGGGAGWLYGGGGGGSDVGNNLGGGGGGGGGQSFASARATDVHFGTASGGGDGVVVLSWSTNPQSRPPSGTTTPDGTIATGCLGRGQLRALDFGPEPLRPCRPGEARVTIPVTDSGQ